MFVRERHEHCAVTQMTKYLPLLGLTARILSGSQFKTEKNLSTEGPRNSLKKLITVTLWLLFVEGCQILAKYYGFRNVVKNVPK